IPSSGQSASAFATDFNAAFRQLGRPRARRIYAHPRLCAYWSTLRATNGQPAFPGATHDGGFMFGCPVPAAEACVLANSPSSSNVYVLETADVVIAQGPVELASSEHAVVEQSSTPTQTSTTAGSPDGPNPAQVVSMFQTDSLAIRARLVCDWGLR